MRFEDGMEQMRAKMEAQRLGHLFAPAAPAGPDPQWRPAPDPATGALLQDPDFTLPTAAGPLPWSLYHDSNTAAQDSEWGWGRRASFPLRLASDGTTVTVMHEDSTLRQYRNFSGSSRYYAVGANYDWLQQNGDGSWDETHTETGFQFHFPAGNAVSVAYRQSPTGQRLTYEYDGSQRLVSVLEPAGRRVTLEYNAAGRVEGVQDWGDRRNTLVYNAAGELVEVEGPTGCITQYGYDAAHRLASIVDPEGYETSYTYDGAGRVLTRSVAGNLGQYTYALDLANNLTTEYTDPLGRVWTYLTSEHGNPLAQVDPLGNRETYLYLNYRLFNHTNALGNVTSYAYDGNGFLRAERDALGNRTTYARDGYGNVVSVINALGYVTSYGYGPNPERRQVLTVMNALGAITSFSYTPAGFLESTTDPLGYVTTQVWSDLGLLDATINALGYRRSYGYDEVGNRVVEIDPLGNRWSSSFDQMGRVVGTENPLGHRRTTLYDARGMVQAEIDPLGNRTSYLWNAEGSQTALINALGYRTSWLYDAANQEIARLDALGYPTSLYYDLAGRQISVDNALGFRNSTVYDAVGRPIAQIDALGYATSWVFDAAGRAVELQDALGSIRTTVFDALSRPVADLNPLGFCRTTVYDRLSRVEARVDPLGRRVSTLFDAAGLPYVQIDAGGYLTTSIFDGAGQLLSSQNPRGFATSRTYDAAGRQIETQDALGNLSTAAFDAAGQVIALVDARASRTTLAYDAAGRQVQRTDPLGRTWTSVFDPVNQVISTVDPRAQVATLVYSPRGEQTSVVYADGTRITQSYDALGQMLEARDNSGITTQSFDARGLLRTVVGPGHPHGAALTYLFDATRQRTGMLFGTGQHTWQYDPASRMTGYTDPDSGLATWSYDAADAMTEQLNPNGTATTWVYDSRGLITGIRHRKSDGSELGVDLYTWDPNGNPTNKRTLSGLNTWSYDALDQLTSEQHEFGIVSTWSYDAAGNRRQQVRIQVGVRTVTNYEYDAASQLTQSTDGNAVTTFVFDANGNLRGEEASAGIKTYSWDPRNLLVSYASPSGQGAAFGPRFDGLRASIEPGGGSTPTKLVWDPLGATGFADLLAETDADQNVLRQYWRGAHLVSYKEPGQKSVYQFDHLGNTERVISMTQSEVSSYLVSAWGEELQTTGSLPGQQFQFGGNWGAFRDSDSGGLWMRLRILSPRVGAFLSEDPLPAGIHGFLLPVVTPPYVYVTNRPIRATDPLGLVPHVSRSCPPTAISGFNTILLALCSLSTSQTLPIITQAVVACVHASQPGCGRYIRSAVPCMANLACSSGFSIDCPEPDGGINACCQYSCGRTSPTSIAPGKCGIQICANNSDFDIECRYRGIPAAIKGALHEMGHCCGLPQIPDCGNTLACCIYYIRSGNWSICA